MMTNSENTTTLLLESWSRKESPCVIKSKYIICWSCTFTINSITILHLILDYSLETALYKVKRQITVSNVFSIVTDTATNNHC